MQYNDEAERAVLNQCLQNKESIIAAAASLKPEDFARQEHRLIYETILQLSENMKTVDMVMIKSELQGKVSVTDIMRIGDEITFGRIEDYIRIVLDGSYLRKVAAKVDKLKAEMEEGAKASDVREELLNWMETLNDSRAEGLAKAKEIIWRHIDTIFDRKADKMKGIMTHLPTLNSYLSNIQPGDMVVLGARTGVGKTAFGLQVVALNAMLGRAVYIVTKEMTMEQVMERILIQQSQVSGSKVKIGKMDAEEEGRLCEWAGRLAEKPIYLDNRSNTVAEIRNNARKVQNLKMIMIDYIGLLSAKGENRTQEVSKISRGLKLLALELQVPILALAQLNRSVDSRSSSELMLSDIRESGSIEQDADIVIFLQRDGEDAEVVLAKHRNGPTGRIKCRYEESTMRYIEEE